MRKLLALGAGLATIPMLLTAARSAPPTALGAIIVPVTHTARTSSYPVYNASGALLRNASYRVTDAGGNCCEVLVSAMSTGRLLELGGGYPFMTDDKGLTWRRVSPTVGNNGEGSIVSAPNGDIVGITWGIDRLTSYKYEAATGQWFSSEVVLHTPFFDRPWLTVAKGPFTPAPGVTAPYLTILHGGYPLKAVEFISYDGLTYVMPDVQSADPTISGSTSGALPVVADPDLDYMQTPYRANTSPLAGFGAIRSGLCGNGTALLSTAGRWSCRTLPGGNMGRANVDSKGWLHEVTTTGRSLRYRVSTNGGASWSTATNALPGGASAAFTGTTIDFKSHGGALKTAVAVRANIGGSGQQDLIFVYSYAGGTPSLTEVHHVGQGDLTVGSSLGAGIRLDFSTVAVLADGKVVASMFDTTVNQPSLAFEL